MWCSGYCKRFVSVIHLKGNTPIKWQGIGQESYEEKEPVVKLVPSDYIIQAAASLALYKEGSGAEFSYV